MEIITNLEDAKDIAIGEHFIFGEYQGEAIEWRKIDEHLAISEKILDCIIFDNESNNKYTKSTLRKWCNNVLGKSLCLPHEDTCCNLYRHIMLKYFPTNESQQAYPTEWAIMHGIYVNDEGKSPYWTASESLNYSAYAYIVRAEGKFSQYLTSHSYIGVRPAVKLK